MPGKIPHTITAMKVLWVDLICPASLFQILIAASRESISKVIYVNKLRGMDALMRGCAVLTQTSFESCDDVELSRERLEERSLFEEIYRRITQLKERLISEPVAAEVISEDHIRSEQWAVHLQEAAYPYLYRPVEMAVLAQWSHPGDESVLLLRASPFKNLIEEFFGHGTVFFYRTMFSQDASIPSRENYSRDRMFNEEYHSDRFYPILSWKLQWFGSVLSGLLLSMFRARPAPPKRRVIGVELMQSRIRPDEVTDLYWFPGSGLRGEDLLGIEMEDYGEDSIDVLRGFQIPRCKVYQNPVKLLRFLLKPEKGEWPLTPVAVDMRTALCSFRWLFLFDSALLRWDLKGWLQLQRAVFHLRMMFWESIYRQLGIRILWSMFDTDPDKMPKAGAMQRLNGLTAGSHWSLFQMYRSDGRKCYDVFFRWGPHFDRDVFGDYPALAVFDAGYPNDHTFTAQEAAAREIRSRHEETFLLCYQDNATAKDMGYPPSTQDDLYRMFLELLSEFDHMALLIKPKRNSQMKDILVRMPELARLRDEGRVEILWGESDRAKTSPAQAGMASDLVVGLGLSTPAAECYFAGAVAFHADLTAFTENAFSQKGRGEVVFTETGSLKNAIERRILGKDTRGHKDFEEFYRRLDLYQDGEAHRRTGAILKSLLTALRDGLDRENAAADVKQKFFDLVNDEEAR